MEQLTLKKMREIIGWPDGEGDGIFSPGENQTTTEEELNNSSPVRPQNVLGFFFIIYDSGSVVFTSKRSNLVSSGEKSSRIFYLKVAIPHCNNSLLQEKVMH